MDRNEEWQRLIEEYRSVPVPAGIRDGIQDAIIRGKKRAAKRRRAAYISTAVSGAAAAILILVLLPNLNAQMAERMGRAPIVGGFFRAVTVRDYNGTQTESAADENGAPMMLGAAYDTEEAVQEGADCGGAPQAKYAGDENGYEQGSGVPEPACADVPENDGIAAYSGGCSEDDSLRSMTMDTDGYTQRVVEHFEAENERDGGRLMLTGYEIVTDSDEWFTLVIYANENADSDSECRTYYNVDKKQDALMTLGELYNDRDYVTIISNEILSQIEAEKTENVQESADEEGMEAPESEISFTQIEEDQNYYFNADGNLVIVLDGNQISADTEEHGEFVIDVSLLE